MRVAALGVGHRIEGELLSWFAWHVHPTVVVRLSQDDAPFRRAEGNRGVGDRVAARVSQDLEASYLVGRGVSRGVLDLLEVVGARSESNGLSSQLCVIV
jgi:hypothetical protein